MSFSDSPGKTQDEITKKLTPLEINEKALDIIEWKLEHGLIDVNHFIKKFYGVSFSS